jgi:hypothetical protein
MGAGGDHKVFVLRCRYTPTINNLVTAAVGDWEHRSGLTATDHFYRQVGWARPLLYL